MELEHCPVHMDLLSAAGYLILCCNIRAAMNPKIVTSRFLFLCKDGNQRSSTSETRYWRCCDRSYVHLLQYHVPCRISSFNTFKLLPAFTTTMLAMFMKPQCARSRSTSGRTVIHPEGNTGYGFVNSGNIFASRVCLLLFIFYWRNVRFLLEQPAQSCLLDNPAFEYLCQRCPVA